MLIDLKKIRASGKEEENFFFEYIPTESLVGLPDATLSLIKINGKVFLTGRHSAYLEGEISYSITADCTRCLTTITKDFVVEFNEELEMNNLEGYEIKNDIIDLTKIVNDRIIMNDPVNFLCKEDCKGICASCGVNLNEEECKCK